jgi:hypothetical protein
MVLKLQHDNRDTDAVPKGPVADKLTALQKGEKEFEKVKSLLEHVLITSHRDWARPIGIFRFSDGLLSSRRHMHCDAS